MSISQLLLFFFSSRRRHTRCLSDWSSDVCSSDLSKCQASPPNQAQGHLVRQKNPPLPHWGPITESQYGGSIQGMHLSGSTPRNTPSQPTTLCPSQTEPILHHQLI